MRRYKMYSTYSILFLLIFLFSSCAKENPTIVVENQPANQIILGEQINDPYNIKNIQIAYTNLKKNYPDAPAIEIKPTHTYMRFLPENEEEWTKLKSDSILILYDYPLDYEIVEHGVSYHDPSLPLSKITWQYCVVPIGHSIPDYIKNEIIYEVCILKEDSDKNFSLKKFFSVEKFWDLLEYESMVLTGNLPDNTNPKTKALLPSKWTPKGYIYYYDNSLGKNVPVVQASVHARWSTHIETCLTDENGYFQTSQFRYKVNYAIKWQRADFEIRDGGLVTQAWYNGPKQKGDWNPVITGGASRMHAIIHRAARDYYYNNPFGIQSPPLNRWYNNILSIKAINENCDQANGDAAPWRRWINLAEIRIFNPSNSAKEIYATTIHELAHTSHWDLASRFKL